MRIALIGPDTSHATAFTKLLNDESHPFHVKGGKVTVMYPFFSSHIPISKNRVTGFVQTLTEEYNVAVADSLADAMKEADAACITAVDGDSHLPLFKELSAYQKPIFIDKPFAHSLADARAILERSEETNTPVMSCSALRFAESLQASRQAIQAPLTGAYIRGPLDFEEEIPGYFWYGIHCVEMLVSMMERSHDKVSVHKTSSGEMLTFHYQGGQTAVVHLEQDAPFEAVIHTEVGSYYAPIYKDQTPFYSLLLQEIINFFQTGHSPVSKEEMFCVIECLEEANALREEKK
ncbi:Gfo/Idh/MocA family oxidoreductase [Priestia koreensis]|uniref:Gfo/Idh/MocA family oxidoreductase n=1 Tax=Priestia koreensis TaxID=284581 RepID=UPI003015DA58